jgi:UDP-GlcNAc:undecaprenyl-phosphate GlcNAc-1-phosphate transferase
MVVAVPLLDVGLSILRRFLGNRPIFGADRGHIHHRLLDSGKTARGAVLNLYLWAALGAAFAILLMLGKAPWHALVLFVFAGFVLAGVRSLRYPEFSMAAKLLLGEFRTTIQRKERVSNLAASIARTRNEDECWDTLAGFGSSVGWVELVWTKDGDVCRRKVFVDDGPRDWSFRIALSDSEALGVQGGLSTGGVAVDLADFAHAVREAIATASRTWQR